MKFQLKISEIEKQHLVIAWLVISLAFGIVIRPDEISLFSILILKYVVIAAITVGAGFLLHELAHKIVAQKFRCWAEFRANFQMLLLALVMSFFGFIFAAPGAVMIRGLVTKKQNGLISVAGPVTNLVLALVFLPLLFIGGFLAELGVYGFIINSWLALFNMIPFSVFDGAKVWRWNKIVYFIVVALALAFVFGQVFFGVTL